MNDNPEADFSRPNIDDSTLDRHLASLPAFDPFVGFEDRVMSRVVVPPPRWVLDLKQRARAFLETRRFRWIAAGTLTTSAVSLVVATTLVWSNWSTVSKAMDRAAASLGSPIWQTFVGFASESAHDLLALSAPVLESRDMSLFVSAAAVGYMAFSALMLFCLMRPNCPTRSR